MKKKFVINRYKLEKCDIILTSDTTFTSKGIRLATLGKYSHAAIYVGGTTIEATLKGVFSKNTQRMMFDKVNQVAIFRSKRELSELEISEICNYARSKVGSLYSLPEAITIKARSALKLDETKGQFCSRLVANSYAAAGYDLSNLRNPAYCTPKQIGLCKSFYQVQDIIRLATNGEIDFANSEDPNTEHQKQTFAWLNSIRNLVRADSSLIDFDIQELNDVNVLLLEHPKYDDSVSKLVKASGYLSHYKREQEINIYRYNNELFSGVLSDQEDKLKFISDELEKEEHILGTYTQNLYGYIGYAKKEKLQFFKLHIELYVNLIVEVHLRLRVIIAGCEFIGEFQFAKEIKEIDCSVVKIMEVGKKELGSDVVRGV